MQVNRGEKNVFLCAPSAHIEEEEEEDKKQ